MLRKLTVAIIAVVLIIGGYFAYETWYGSDDPEATALMKIPEGSSFSDILDTLDAAGLLRGRAAFKVLAVTTGRDSRIKPGTYKFGRGISNLELLNALVEGRSTVKVKVTFPEGITVRRIASILAREAGCDSAEIGRLATDRTFLKTLGINAAT